MSAPTESTDKKQTLTISPHQHQEQSRIRSEIEELFFSSQAESLPVEAIQFYLLNDLGYTDINEFEDALGGTFVDFLGKMENVKVWDAKKVGLEGEESTTEDAPDYEPKLLFSVSPPVRNNPRTLTLKVSSKDELWRTFTFAPAPASVSIPELEFEIAGPEKKTVDSIYNHLCTAVTNLEQHADRSAHALGRQQVAEEGEGGEKNDESIIKKGEELESVKKLRQAIKELRACLDLDWEVLGFEGFSWVVEDLEGVCSIEGEGVVVVEEA